MRALPVQPEPLWRTDFRQRIAVSLWFLPAILVFDREITLDQIPDGYKAMDDRTALKVLVRP